MLVKKLILLFTTVIITAAFSACGGGDSDIPMSKLSFGMSMEEVQSVIKINPQPDNDFEFILDYIGTFDIDSNTWHSSFWFNDDDKLWEIFLAGDDMPHEECFDYKDELIKNLSGLYGVPESDWDIQNDGYSNFLDYRNEDEQLIQLYIRLYDGEQEDSACITMLLKSYDDIPVIPKN